MTIYILDTDPEICAQSLDDKSLDRMIKSIARTLCNAHYLNVANDVVDTGNTEIDFSAIPLKHSKNILDCLWSFWARDCVSNYKYLVELGICLCREYHFRNSERCDKDKVNNGDDHCGAWHKMRDVIDWCRDHVPDLPFGNAVKDCIYCDYDQEKDTNCLGCYSCDTHAWSITTPFPLVMPKKYIKTVPCPCCDGGYEELDCICIPLEYSNDDIILSYRNYYRAQLIKKISLCSNNHIALTNHENDCIKWTGREKSEWLNLENLYA